MTSDRIPFASLAEPQIPRKGVIWNFGCALVLGVIANLVPVYFILPMLKMPRGTSMRPMVEASSILLGTLIGFVAFAFAIRCAAKDHRWWVGWVFAIIGGLVSLAPWFVGKALFNWVVTKQGFVLEP